MKNLHFVCIAGLVVLLLCSLSGCKALDCRPSKSIITVDKKGRGNFKSVQSAIDSIPEGNTEWIRIRIYPGKYTEKVTISAKKSCIFLDGVDRRVTSIEWGDHDTTRNSATFTINSDNILAKGIAFKNTYNLPAGLDKFTWKQAVSTVINGDKCAFHGCSFQGFQDTLWDEKGRHYFYACFIEGAIDFIFGKAQSIYENCQIVVNGGKYEPGLTGYITAQKKEVPQISSGFVFKNCLIGGTGKAYLGRAWGPYSTVIFYNSSMSDVIVPQGWDAWAYVNHEANFTYAEAHNKGKGADTSKRVPWINKISEDELRKFLDISYVDADGWLAKAPPSFLRK